MVAVRFCPQLFRLQSTVQAPGAAVGKQQAEEAGPSTADEQENTAQQPFQLPYRMVFAIATLDSIIVYDTQVRTISIPACSYCCHKPVTHIVPVTACCRLETSLVSMH